MCLCQLAGKQFALLPSRLSVCVLLPCCVPLHCHSAVCGESKYERLGFLGGAVRVAGDLQHSEACMAWYSIAACMGVQGFVLYALLHGILWTMIIAVLSICNKAYLCL